MDFDHTTDTISERPGGTNINISTGGVTRLQVTQAGSVIFGSGSLATNATDGFNYVAATPGTPTGTPTAQTGRAPITIDSTNNLLYFYTNGAWRQAGSGTGGGGGRPDCRVATTGNINLASPGATIDGVTMASGDRVLVWQQTTPSQNGVYTWNGAAVAMTRVSDMSTDWNNQVPGRSFFILEGNTYGDYFSFVSDTAPGGTFGTTAITINGTNARIGPMLYGNSATLTRAASGGFGQRNFTHIDTNAQIRNWRFVSTGTGNSSGLELIVGNNDDLANTANYWWDISTNSQDQEGFRISRRTGGGDGADSHLFIDSAGRVTVGPTAKTAGSSSPATTNLADFQVAGTGVSILSVGTTAQRPATVVDGMWRFNSDDNVPEVGYASPAGGTTSWLGLQRNAVFHRRRTVVDEFLGFLPATTGNSVGDLSWVIGSAGTNTNAVQTAVTDHPGIWRLTCGTTSGNEARIHLGTASNSGVIIPTDVQYFAWLIRIPTITSIDLKFGLLQNVANVTQGQSGTDGVWFEFFPATNAALRFYTRSASTSSTPTATVTVVANTWYLCEAYRNPSTGSWTPRVNGTNYTTISTNVPSVACNVGAYVETLTTAARSLDLDYFSLMTEELGNRY